MVPLRIYVVGRMALLAAVVTVMAVAGCEAGGPAAKPSNGGKPAARPSSDKSGGFLKLPSFSGGGYATIFTIRCMEAKGPEGARRCEQMARGLRNVKGLDASTVKVETRGEISSLYYGAYKGEVNKAADQFIPPAKAREDLNLLRSMESGQLRPFQLALLVEMPTPDPGPPEWNLKNAPGVYTLQICHCFDKPGLPNHKEVAVSIVKALREQGEEAWYLHNDRISVVTVGHFDETAVERGADGRLRYGPAVLALQNKREEFKYNTENLLKVARVLGNQRVYAPSMLIYIREPVNEPAAARAQPQPGPTVNPFGHR